MTFSQILDLGVLNILIKMVGSSYTEEAIKALYAISALIRNNEHGQELFFLANGHLMLQVSNKVSRIIWIAYFFYC